MKKIDVLIVGGGLAAIMCALKLPDHLTVTMVMKGSTKEGNSWKAQGGIAAALGRTDSPLLHQIDTLKAGCEINDRKMVSILVKEGATRLKKWMNEGLCFDKDASGQVIFAQEGAHGQRRIVHAGGDQTGKRTMEFFSKLVKNRAEVIENHAAIDLIVENGTCYGATFIDDNAKLTTIYANETVIATGGIGGLFQETSNDHHITGDGIAIAHRAGAELMNMEYVQFHPTLIFSQGKAVGLASEALRGEGATLINQFGKRVMDKVHPLKELAPRDVVARKLFSHVQQGDQLFLDISSIKEFSKRFPQITQLCETAGVDWKQGKIPIRPGAHFHMGGIKTNEHGQTSISQLFAVGEVACNGVHGANRLASNSLLEAIVFGERTGEWIAKNHLILSEPKMKDRKRKELYHPKVPSKKEVQKRVSVALGVVRNGLTLQKFILWIEKYDTHVWMCRPRNDWSKEELEISNMMITSLLTAKAALANETSCGAHFRQEKKGRKLYEQTPAKTTVG
ncbi:L-aspartate oxidase [Salipaludibacillus daqingensis]|uniref:L-aspartate oxidase n=1 Tax=Salipaludibacillus daqingensis TaxID=3041001 RepID=UPI00247565B4|nr:L-aspartate oxidase [Salipaludibacillus daqingensis]